MSEDPRGLRPELNVALARPAAVVALLRPRGPAGHELFVVRRSRELKMFGGFVALVGGGVDGADVAAGQARGLAPELCAAVRELFEEAGVLLASPPPDRAELDTLRRGLTARPATPEHLPPARFWQLLDERGLTLAAERLIPAGRWVTPRFVPVRFDAHIFLVLALAGEEPEVWPGELADGEWIDPAALMARWETGEVLLHPPQSHLARTLAASNAEQQSGRGPLEPLATRVASGGHRDPEQVAARVDFQGGVQVHPLVTPTLPPAQHTNCYLLGTGDLLVVDPGSPYADEQEALAALLDEHRAEGRRPVGVFLTHHHADHVSGAVPCAAHLGVPLMAHAATFERLPHVQSEAARLGVALRLIAEGEMLELGGPRPQRWRAVFTPGHARGHLCLYEEATGTLIAGDMVSTLSTIIIDPPEGHLGDYLASLERLRTLGPRNLYPAHGLVTGHAVPKLEEYLLHRRARAEALVAALASRPRPIEELVAEVYSDVPAAIHPLAARSALASLQWLEEQGRVLRAGERWLLA